LRENGLHVVTFWQFASIFGIEQTGKNIMAIAIKSIPTLKSKEADKFIGQAKKNAKAKSSVNFSGKINSAKNILKKSKI
jgi:hypothetical protein